jgi:hypothetical protein
MRLFHLIPPVKRPLRFLFMLPPLCLCMMGVGTDSAGAAAAGAPIWEIRSVALPSNFSLGDNESCEAGGGCDSYLVTVSNIGAAPTEGGSTVTVTDALPPGTVVKQVIGEQAREVGSGKEQVACTEEVGASSVRCEDSEPIPPGGLLEISIEVSVTLGMPTSVVNKATVEGGGAASAATKEPSTVPNTLNEQTPIFGPENFAMALYGPEGEAGAQAGEHPAAFTSTINLTTKATFGTERFLTERFHAVEEPKTEIVDLPPGFLGDPLAAAQCPQSTLRGTNEGERHCPANSRVGIVRIEEAGAGAGGGVGVASEHYIYNAVPEPGYPAMFGFELIGAAVFLRARVIPASSGYALSIAVSDIPRAESVKVTGVSLTVFGDPAEADGNVASPLALFTNPSDCGTGPLKAKLEMDSWVDPQRWASKETTMYEASPGQGVSGCDLLQFEPTLALTPEQTQADTPTGYEVDLKVPQAPNIAPDLATPDLKNAVLTLPEGVSVSPGAADGLVACQEAGPEGINITHGWTPTGEQPLDPADPEAMEIASDGLPHVAPGHCPLKSQIGTVEITTPLLASPLKGHVYVAQPLCGGTGQPACSEAEAVNGNIFRLYLEAEGSGVIVKLEGKVSANPNTGQLTTTFKENPQLPFSELKLMLNGGPRAPLANPQSCGEAKTTSSLEPWSAPESGPAATPFSSFSVTGCASPMPFAPDFLAQTATPSAGSFSPFTTTFSRHDGEQDLSGITVTTPPGLLGKISEVPLCQEPQASQGTCGPQSLIGHTLVAAGAGSHPFFNPGTVYLTGPYKGQPFGLSIVTSAKAGPFNLGNVIVRASIHVDPHTSALTVTSDPLPQIIDGVPLRIQTVNVTIDKPGFMFNPTNCNQQQITATITAAQGAAANVATPFAASGCKNLPFKPKFTVLTQAKTSKAGGAYLHVKVVSGSGQANIGKVKVDLPKQLPSRLTTLQKACVAAVFEANPANCPAASTVGTATAITPVLKSALTGPAYLVSHGGEAFPDLVIVLQGEGITIDLVGNTNIKKGITSSTFKTVPDAPISTFDLVLPEGPHSALTANGNLCSTTLNMPTALTGQNGAVIKQTTKIAVSGCSKHKKLQRRHKRHSTKPHK